MSKFIINIPYQQKVSGQPIFEARASYVASISPLLYSLNDTLPVHSSGPLLQLCQQTFTLEETLNRGIKIPEWQWLEQCRSLHLCHLIVSNPQGWSETPHSWGPQLCLPCWSVTLSIQVPHRSITSISEPTTRQKRGPPFKTLPGYSISLSYWHPAGQNFVTWEMKSVFWLPLGTNNLRVREEGILGISSLLFKDESEKAGGKVKVKARNETLQLSWMCFNLEINFLKNGGIIPLTTHSITNVKM